MPRAEREVIRDFLDGDPLLPTADVAWIMRVDTATVARWVQRGWFPDFTAAGLPAVVRLPGNQYRIRASVVQAMVNGTIEWRVPDGDPDR